MDEYGKDVLEEQPLGLRRTVRPRDTAGSTGALGTPPTDQPQVIVNLIGATTTRTGLTVRAETNAYPRGFVRV